jgi:hypothetical protein
MYSLKSAPGGAEEQLVDPSKTGRSTSFLRMLHCSGVPIGFCIMPPKDAKVGASVPNPQQLRSISVHAVLL